MRLRGRTEKEITPEELLQEGARQMLILYYALKRITSVSWVAKSLAPIAIILANLALCLIWRLYAWAGPGIGLEMAGLTWQRLLVVLLVDAAALAIWLVDLRYIRRFSLGLPERIRRAGLIERLAAGPGALPDVFAYTPFPWRMFLGARPKTFKHTARLLAANLDWYLLPEPRRYYRIYWLYLLFIYAGSLVCLVTSYAYIFIGPQAQYQVPAVMSFDSYQLIMLFILSIALLMSHEVLRLGACAKALQQEVQLRLAGPGAAGGGQS